jgi:CobQ-like glutamine amidotransferase family enzyme
MRSIKIVHLYAEEMNIYGDNGNALVLKRRLEWRGYRPELVRIGAGEKLPADTDIILGGGGQDSGQARVEDDLRRKHKTLHRMGEDGVAMLMICGLYQLFGHYFLTATGETLPGIGYFDAHTKAGEGRLIGNMAVESPFGTLVGYENHSGRTYLGAHQDPLGRTRSGQGNNGEDGQEGAVRIHTVGSYLHGPVLAKSPGLADTLLHWAIERRYGRTQLEQLDDTLECAAAVSALRLKR